MTFLRTAFAFGLSAAATLCYAQTGTTTPGGTFTSPSVTPIPPIGSASTGASAAPAPGSTTASPNMPSSSPDFPDPLGNRTTSPGVLGNTPPSPGVIGTPNTGTAAPNLGTSPALPSSPGCLGGTIGTMTNCPPSR